MIVCSTLVRDRVTCDADKREFGEGKHTYTHTDTKTDAHMICSSHTHRYRHVRTHVPCMTYKHTRIHWHTLHSKHDGVVDNFVINSESFTTT